MTVTASADIIGLLKKHFGYEGFRPMQEDIIKTVLRGEDVLVVMPTGGGKSMCYQMPALCIDGVTLVISPLISLMQDQVDGLRADGITAAYLNSSQTGAEQAEVKRDLQAGKIKLLYVAPERLSAAGFHDFLGSVNMQLIAVDEAHCISGWGHEFRPDYRNLVALRKTFPQVPCIALTATATPQVREDICEQLSLGGAKVFLSTFNRPNLTYHVYRKDRAFERMLLALRKPGRLPAIIYCFSRKDTESTAEDLRNEGFACLPYHAGLDISVRQKTQEKFMRDEVNVIAATVAFGMGIDKPDVRTVVHLDLPKNIEGYYQETGRAGRDGLQSDRLLFYSAADRFKQEFFIKEMTDPMQQAISRQNLDAMVGFGELRSCRRAYLLNYFGETGMPENCASCDRCLLKEELFDATEVTGKILSAVVRTGERFGGAHIADVLRGARLAKIREFGHDQLSVFDIEKQWDAIQLKEIIGSLVEQKLLVKAPGQYPTLSLSEAGRDFLKEKKTVMLPRPQDEIRVAERKVTEDLAFDQDLFEELRIVRHGIADAEDVAAFIVFGDRSLREMAAYYPQTMDAFRKIYGVSDKKLERYGGRFLAAIQAYAEKHGKQEQEIPSIDRSEQKLKRERAVQRKGSTFEETRILLLQKLPIAEIARIRGLKESTITQHVEDIAVADPSIDVEYLRPAPELFDPIAKAFDLVGMEALGPVFGHCKAMYTFDLLRLVRLFLRREAMTKNAESPRA